MSGLAGYRSGLHMSFLPGGPASMCYHFECRDVYVRGGDVYVCLGFAVTYAIVPPYAVVLSHSTL
jgi:hypothetical protein